MNHLVVILLALTALSFSGCAEKVSRIDREKAKTLLLSNAGRFTDGKMLPYERTIELPKQIQIKDLETSRLLKDLEKHGLIILSPVTRLYQVYPEFKISLTEKSQKSRRGDATSLPGGGYKMLSCTLDFSEVTGIEESADHRKASVHFELKLKGNATIFAIFDQEACLSMQRFVANLSLYDDGWRIASINRE